MDCCKWNLYGKRSNLSAAFVSLVNQFSSPSIPLSLITEDNHIFFGNLLQKPCNFIIDKKKHKFSVSWSKT